jgi:signal transduction histidine kinase
VVLAGEPYSQGVVLSVSDNGQGIPEKDLGHVFDSFYRADADRSRKKGGYGIGLSAAKAIASANQGSIHAAYEEDRLVFTVVLRAG